MRRILAVSAAVLLVVAGCGSTEPAPETATSSSATSSSVTSSTTSTSSTTPEPEPAAEPAPDPAPTPAAPVFVNCYLADGTALMSDGTHTYVESCDESAGGPYLLEDGRSIYDAPPAPADTPAATYPGWHCDGPAYLCRDDQASGKTEGQQN